MLLGAHMSVAGGVERALERGERIGCTAIQIFTKNNNQWAAPPLSEASIAAFRDVWHTTAIESVVAHTSYLINLASLDDALWEQSVDAYRIEIERCALLGIRHLVVHPGSPRDGGAEAGIRRVAEGLNRAHRATRTLKVVTCLETTAGQGAHLGRLFEELAAIMRRVRARRRVAVCLDTCHVFAAGYDMRTPAGYRSMMRRFDAVIGLQHLVAIHVNDSKGALGGRVDRHAHIGQGAIGPGGFRALMQDRRLDRVPKILETPKGKDMKEDVVNMEALVSLSLK